MKTCSVQRGHTISGGGYDDPLWDRSQMWNVYLLTVPIHMPTVSSVVKRNEVTIPLLLTGQDFKAKVFIFSNN